MTARLPHLHDTLPEKTPFAPFASRRSVVYATKGMVACSQPLAAQAGLEILKLGGNAADAAVAVSAALNVLEPHSCGIGGDAFCLYWDAKSKKVSGLNGSGRSPKALTLEEARRRGLKDERIPGTDLNSVTVPGCTAAWADTIEYLGSGKVTLAQALGPAITLAEDGAPISEVASYMWKKARNRLMTQSPSGHELLITDPATGETHAPSPGEVIKNPTLAATFREVAKLGKKGFYEGRIAEAIVEREAFPSRRASHGADVSTHNKVVQSQNGVMTLEDLASHTTAQVEPISLSYGGPEGVTLHEIPPNGGGITALIAIGILEALEESGVVDMNAMAHNETAWLHTLIEVMRFAFADSRAHVSDPDIAKVPVEKLLSRDYLKERAALFSHTTSNLGVSQGFPHSSSDTVLFTVTDSEGNAASFIQSVYTVRFQLISDFGSHAIPKGCGFALQNRGCNFFLEEGHPNCLGPSRRPYHTILPAMVTRGDKLGGDLFMTFGVMGGWMQPQGHLQILMNMLHRNLNPQSALDAPRFCIAPAEPSAGGNAAIPTKVYIEDGISEAVVEELRKLGHNVVVLKGHQRAMFGRGQVNQASISPIRRLD
ncbi:gamma-glutamyltranspeptidase / glutathione hydrolase, partial [Phenoliferia sp. Uapishka_3]